VTYGPGTTLLATLTHRDVEEVATKPAVAVRAMADLVRDLARLAADASSPDAAVREAARQRAEEVRALAAASPRPDTAAAREGFERRVREALTQILRDLEEAGGARRP
jgi:hypothetical protein